MALKAKNKRRYLALLARRGTRTKAITRVEAGKIAALAGCNDATTVSHFHDWLNREAEVLRVIPNILANDRASTRAVQEEVSELEKPAAALEAALKKVRPYTLQQIEVFYESPTPNRLSRDIAGVRRLQRALGKTSAAVATGRGRPISSPNRVAAALLAEKYQQLSNTPFKFYVAPTGGPDPWKRPSTHPATKFVAAGLRAIFPEIDDTALTTAMRQHKLR